MTKVKCAQCHNDVGRVTTDKYGKCLVCSPTQVPVLNVKKRKGEPVKK